MATPICYRNPDAPQWAKLDYCHDQCGRALSNRRPPCPHQGPRLWECLPDNYRAQLQANKEYRKRKAAFDKAMLRAQGYSPLLANAIAKSNELGRTRVTVPMEALESLIRLARVQAYTTPILGASTDNVDGEEPS